MHLQSLKLLSLMVKEEMHLQENTFFDFDITENVAHYPLCQVTCATAKFEVATSNG